MRISTALYGTAHHKNGIANAFRHALWNYLIAKECQNWNKNLDKVLAWTEKITNWHEAAFPNKELAKKMDLHNNQIGRLLFKDNSQRSEDEAVDTIAKMAADSILVDREAALDNHKNTLVHIIEE
ncbi:hypothetical protein M3P07_09890 [Flagellimonas sp. 2012CJ39-3]|nr:hypothetical protein [Muricauda myxillae]MCL6266793.1 hypothetical protein [Muricauda myxillae]